MAWSRPCGRDWWLPREGSHVAAAVIPSSVRDDNRSGFLQRTVTADPLPSMGEVRRRVQQAVPGGPEWPPVNLLPMLLDAGTVALASFPLGVIPRSTLLLLPHVWCIVSAG